MTKFDNILEAYISMQKENGLSVKEALEIACSGSGRNYNDKYLNVWVKGSSKVPDEVVRYMQIATADYIFSQLNITVSPKTAFNAAMAFASPVKKF